MERPQLRETNVPLHCTGLQAGGDNVQQMGTDDNTLPCRGILGSKVKIMEISPQKASLLSAVVEGVCHSPRRHCKVAERISPVAGASPTALK